MHSLQIRELPPALYDLLSFKAQQQHRSLTQQAIAELEHALQPPVQNMRRMQLLHKLRERDSSPFKNLDAKLVQWQREDRER